MKNFFENEINVTKIVFACFVPTAHGDRVHNDRPSHGIAINVGDTDKYYVFSTGKTIKVGKNELIFLPLRSSYVVNGETLGDAYCINFLTDSDEVYEPALLNVKNPSYVVECYKRAVKVWEKMHPSRDLKCKAELYNVLFEISSQSMSAYLPAYKTDIIETAINYIHENYSVPSLSCARLASMCRISYEYFRRLFKEKFGCSPIKYVNDLRLRRVKELLLSGFYSVSEAAEQSGFCDMSYFSRFFKKNVGISPSEYLSRRN